MREERVTINILNWLEENSWQIVCYDFPQSGTGILLHPNGDNRTEKNKGGIIPDIIAVKDAIALFFENKDRFYQPDFDKLFEIKNESNYLDSLSKLLANFKYKYIFYGAGIPNNTTDVQKSLQNLDKIDFIVSVEESGVVNVIWEKEKIF